MLVDLFKIVLTLTVASIGGMFFDKWKVPGGAIIGAIAAVVILNLSSAAAGQAALSYIPNNLRIFIQMFAGMKLGSNISKKDILDLKKLLVPAGILIGTMIILNLMFGTLMSALGGLDIATSLFSSAPGGMSDMVIIADEMGANSVYVVVLHLSRVLFIFFVMPPVLRWFQKKIGHSGARSTDAPVQEQAPDAALEAPRPAPIVLTLRQKAQRFAATVAAGIAVGLLLWKGGVKAGALLGSMTGVALLNVLTECTFFPKALNLPVRFVMGAYIGQQIDMQSLMMMTTLGVPVLLIWLSIPVYSFVVPLIIAKCSKLDLMTCIFSSIPGGMQEMSLLSEDLGVDVAKVSLLQAARQVVIIMIFPTMLSAITTLLTR